MGPWSFLSYSGSISMLWTDTVLSLPPPGQEFPSNSSLWMNEWGQSLDGSLFLARKPKLNEQTLSPWEKPTLLSTAGISLMRLAIAKANRKRVLHIIFRREVEQRGSKDGSLSHFRTTSRFHETKVLSLFCFIVWNDFTRSSVSEFDERSKALYLKTELSIAQ